MSLVADQNALAPLFLVGGHLHVDLGHQRTDCVEHPQVAGLGFLTDSLGHAMRRKDNNRIVRHLVELIDKYGALVAQAVHHVFVVHHLMPDIDGCAKKLQRALDDSDCAIDTSTKTAGIGEMNLHWRLLNHAFDRRIGRGNWGLCPNDPKGNRSPFGIRPGNPENNLSADACLQTLNRRVIASPLFYRRLASRPAAPEIPSQISSAAPTVIAESAILKAG